MRPRIQDPGSTTLEFLHFQAASGTCKVCFAQVQVRCHSVQRQSSVKEYNTMAGRTWKVAVLVAVMTILAFLEFRTVEAQISGCGQCAANAYCYYNSCICRRGWYGDGYIGSGYSGCQRRRLRTWQVVVSIIGAILGALLILCVCLACVRNCLLRRRARSGPFVQQPQPGPGDPVYGYPQQASYPQQGVPMYQTNMNMNQKVPGPAGVV
ncbi:hypothetical protein KC19_2G291400 [Ceratodon purpureus]|uniref:Uncharacterized protein n=1 Tax=Ceratodon purpureus TaxID=3225 RepID=A0A8T0IZF1_CERPU|nr:hypothetical protein KC19_2G291400 [Ceratodon purpureus]